MYLATIITTIYEASTIKHVVREHQAKEVKPEVKFRGLVSSPYHPAALFSQFSLKSPSILITVDMGLVYHYVKKEKCKPG